MFFLFLYIYIYISAAAAAVSCADITEFFDLPLLVCLFGFYGISTFVDYLMPNSFLYIWTVLFQTIQFSISTQFSCQKHFYFKLFSFVRGYPHGVVVNTMDCGTVVSEFKLKSHYYVHFQTITLWERYEPPHPPSYGLNSTTNVLLEGWIWN